MGTEPLFDSPVYRCPYCDAVLDHVTVTECVPLLTDDGRRRHPVDSTRLAAVVASYRRGGAEAVMADLKVGRSQAFRLIAQSREESANGN